MTRNSWLIFIVICITLIGGLVWTSRSNSADVSNIDTNKIQAASPESGNIADQTLGNPNAKVVIINYSDYQCPGCSQASPVMKEVADKYKNDVVFIFRNFAFLQPNSRAAAAAAEAAGLQDAFWEMNELIYASQNEWSQASLEQRTTFFKQYASQLGLDVGKFETDMNSDAVKKKIDFDKALANQVGVNSTPSIYVNGKIASASYKDGEVVPDGTAGSRPVWASAELFEKHMLLPEFEKQGIDIK